MSFIIVTSSTDRLNFDYGDYASIFALGEPVPQPLAIFKNSALKSDFGNIELINDPDGNSRVRVEFKRKGGYCQVCNDGTYDLLGSLAAGVTIIESINGVTTDSSNEDLYDKIIAALG